MSRLKITGYIDYDDVDDEFKDPKDESGVTHQYWDGELSVTYVGDLEDVDIELVGDDD